jgi:hypothetical protein
MHLQTTCVTYNVAAQVSLSYVWESYVHLKIRLEARCMKEMVAALRFL